MSMDRSKMALIQMMAFCCFVALIVGCSKVDQKRESPSNYEMNTETYAGHILFVNVQDLQEIRKLALSQEDSVPDWISTSKFEGFDEIEWSICRDDDIRGGKSISECVLDYDIIYKMNPKYLGRSFSEIPSDDWLVGAFDRGSGVRYIAISTEGKIVKLR
jgi:hypothetical protein